MGKDKATSFEDALEGPPFPLSVPQSGGEKESGGGSETTPSAHLIELGTKHLELLSIQIPKEILGAAEEIVSGIEGPGIEPSMLIYLLQVVLYLDRQKRTP